MTPTRTTIGDLSDLLPSWRLSLRARNRAPRTVASYLDTAERFIAFLRRLCKDAGQKVFLIVDNLRVHHAKLVKTWAAAHAHEIELFYLPAYAPDHNPDEYLNNDLKQKLRQRPQPASQEELLKSTRAVLRAIQRSPRRIQAYFKPQPVRYAA